MNDIVYPYGERWWKLAVLFVFFIACVFGFGVIALAPATGPAWNGFHPQGWGVLAAKGFIGALGVICAFLLLMVVWRVGVNLRWNLKLKLSADEIVAPVGLSGGRYVKVSYGQIDRLVLHKILTAPAILSVHYGDLELAIPEMYLPDKAAFDVLVANLARTSNLVIE